MNRLRYCLAMMLVTCILFINVVEVYAMDTGFSTEKISEKDKTLFISNINISLLMEKPSKRAILCFDVNENGMIAIGQEGTDGKELCIYSSDGNFQYGYSFDCGQSFGVEWSGEDINIYFVRSDVIITIDREGELRDIAKVQNTIENNTYQNFLLYSTERTVGDTRYTIRNDMGILNLVASSYSQLVTTNSVGENIILYDVNSAQFAKTLTICVLAVLFFGVAVSATVWNIIRLKRNL